VETKGLQLMLKREHYTEKVIVGILTIWERWRTHTTLETVDSAAAIGGDMNRLHFFYGKHNREKWALGHMRGEDFSLGAIIAASVLYFAQTDRG
jgi:hypothetical protein